MFALIKAVCEKYLEKTYDKVDRVTLYVLRMYGMGKKLVRALESFYKENEFV